MDFRSWCLRYFPGGTFSDGGDQYSCRNHYRDEKNASLSFCDSRRAWNDFGQGEGGKISEFCREHGLPEWDGAPEHREERKPLPAPNERASEARRLWEQGNPVANHPYLTRKGIDGQGCRVTGDGTLLVPAYTLSGGDVVGVERIDAAGSKKHLGTKGGAFFPCGDVKDGKTVLIAEGFATAKSIHAITGFPTLAAFGAVNLLGAAQSLRGREVLICPDADDAGRKTAAQCRAAGFRVVELPPDSRNGLDWNDVMVEQGLEPAKALFRDRWAVAQVERVEAPREEKKPKYDFPMMTAKELYQADFPREEWPIDQIIPQGLSVLAAPGKTGKSFMVLQMGMAITHGRPFLGQKTKKGPVIYAALEDSFAALKDRMISVFPDMSELSDDFHMLTEFPRLDEEGLGYLTSMIEKIKPVLCVFDTWVKVKPVGKSKRDENVYESDSRFSSEIKKVADRYGTAILLLTHFHKGGGQRKDWLEAITGSLGLVGVADQLLAIERERNAITGILKRAGRKLVDSEEIGMNWINPGWEFCGNAQEMLQSTQRQEILSVVKEAGEPVSARYAAEMLGKNQNTVKNLMRKMVKAGTLNVTSQGRYFPNDGYTDRRFPKEEDSRDDETVVGVVSVVGCSQRSRCSPVVTPVVQTTVDYGDDESVVGAEPSDTKRPEGSDYGDYGDYTNHTKGNLEPFFPGGLKTGLSLPRGGPSIEDLASRAGVSQAAVQEELDRWKKCGRLKEDGDGTIHLLAGTSYPGQGEDVPEDEDEPPVSAPKGPPKTLRLPAPSERRHIGMKDVSLSDALAWAQSVPGLVAQLKARAVKEHDPVMERSARDLYESLVRIEYADHLQRGLDGEAPGQAALFFPPDEPPAPATPPKEPSTPRGEDRSGPPPGWLEEQPEAVQAEYRAKVKRLKGVDMPDYEGVALLRTWEEFRGRR